MVQLPVNHSAKHQGKTLRLDATTETLTVIGQADDPLGTVPWDAIIDFVNGFSKPDHTPRPVRNYPRSQLAAKLRYAASGRSDFNGVTCEIGGGGIFIETSSPQSIGTDLSLELVLPDDQTQPITARGKVAWIRSREERHVFYPGMGIQFTEISDGARTRIVNMVKSLDSARSRP
jgi:type IV pilus assembly protein PilZ